MKLKTHSVGRYWLTNTASGVIVETSRHHEGVEPVALTFVPGELWDNDRQEFRGICNPVIGGDANDE